jgi:hypothetical protein
MSTERNHGVIDPLQAERHLVEVGDCTDRGIQSIDLAGPVVDVVDLGQTDVERRGGSLAREIRVDLGKRKTCKLQVLGMADHGDATSGLDPDGHRVPAADMAVGQGVDG